MAYELYDLELFSIWRHIVEDATIRVGALRDVPRSEAVRSAAAEAVEALDKLERALNAELDRIYDGLRERMKVF